MCLPSSIRQGGFALRGRNVRARPDEHLCQFEHMAGARPAKTPPCASLLPALAHRLLPLTPAGGAPIILKLRKPDPLALRRVSSVWAGDTMSDTIEVYKPLTPVQEEIVSALKMGNTRQASFGYVGVAKSSFYRWIDDNGTFRDAVTRAEASAEVSHVGILAQAAAGGDWRASLEWLKRRKRDEWGDNIAVSADKEALAIIAQLFPEDANAGVGEVETGSES